MAKAVLAHWDSTADEPLAMTSVLVVTLHGENDSLTRDDMEAIARAFLERYTEHLTLISNREAHFLAHLRGILVHDMIEHLGPWVPKDHPARTGGF